LPQSVPPRGPSRAGGARRGRARRDPAPEGGRREDPERPVRPAPGRRDPRVHGDGAGAGGASYTHTDHYWQVYFATNAAIADTFGTAGYPAPESIHRVRQG